MTAQCQQVKDLVTIDLCDEGVQAAQTNSSAPSTEGCSNLLCAAEKDKLREEIKALKQNLADYTG